MNSAQTRLAIADLTATLATDFDVPALLHAVAEHACQCFDAVSAAVILLDNRPDGTGIQIVAEAGGEDTIADPRLHISGPGLASARDGAVAVITDIDRLDEGSRWPDYRDRARLAGMRSVRAFPVKAMTVPLGSVVVHAGEPWGPERPNDFGQILADLTAIALSMGTDHGRVSTTADTVAAVLDGTSVIATAVGILAEYFDLDLDAARGRLRKLARAHQITPTAQAAAVVEAQNADPTDPGIAPALHLPEEPVPPTRIDR
ncbi:GAF and ANTAR domain-containing protein [Nocardia sp. NPDC050413]|uniref:GAF and ANTAR domain-containing protein n=1 Tax=Nocardia sp. NPDC050413 TaxID=3155784 RepID=UPI00340F870D